VQWVQQIISQLIHLGDPTIPAGTLSPWVDLRFVPRGVMLQGLEEHNGRRFMQTHLPLDAMVWNEV
jgi:aryl sulfotransferase